jgi:hypothetical protein
MFCEFGVSHSQGYASQVDIVVDIHRETRQKGWDLFSATFQ